MYMNIMMLQYQSWTYNNSDLVPPKADTGTQQNDKLQFHQLNTLMLDSDITVEGLPQTMNTFF